MKKPILAVDIDDCLADYVGDFLPFLETHGLRIAREGIVRSLTEMGVSPDLFRRFEQDGHLATLKPLPDSQRSLRILAGFFEIVAMTSRNQEVARETRAWIALHFPCIRDTCFTRDKGGLCRELGAWGLVDDQVRFAEQFLNSFVIAAPWNAGWMGRRGSWEDMTRTILWDVIVIAQ